MLQILTHRLSPIRWCKTLESLDEQTQIWKSYEIKPLKSTYKQRRGTKKKGFK